MQTNVKTSLRAAVMLGILTEYTNIPTCLLTVVQINQLMLNRTYAGKKTHYNYCTRQSPTSDFNPSAAT